MTRSHSKTESRPGSILTAPKGKLRYKQFLLSVISLTLACSKRTENSGSSKAWINGHPSGDIKCAICHARSIPVATIAVGIVAATANTSGTKFYHSSKNIGSNDCSVCHPWNYAGQVNGWAHGNFGNRHSGINSNCLECHETPTGQITDSERQTPSGRSFTIHFHNLIPTGFSEDPGRAHDCSVCEHGVADTICEFCHGVRCCWSD